MTRKICLWNFDEKVFETLTENNLHKGYECLFHLIFDWAEGLTYLKFKSFD